MSAPKSVYVALLLLTAWVVAHLLYSPRAAVAMVGFFAVAVSAVRLLVWVFSDDSYSKLKADLSRQMEIANIATQEIEDLRGWLRILEPHLDAVICYASTMSEHPPNRAVKEVREYLGKELREE